MEIKEEIIEEIHILDDQANLNKVTINLNQISPINTYFSMKKIDVLNEIKFILDGNTRGNNEFR